MYTIVESGGRQYRAEVGQTIQTEKLPYEVGETINLDKVLLIADSEGATVGLLVRAQQRRGSQARRLGLV